MSKSRTYTLSPSILESNRVADRAREERIAALTNLLHVAIAGGDSNEFRRLQREHKAAILARSRDQLARMRCTAAEAKS